MPRPFFSFVLTSALLLLNCTTAPAQSAPPTAPAAPVSSVAQQAQHDDSAEDVAEILKEIAGKEDLPAEQVFKNIQIMKGVPAGRLLRIMQFGYSRSLGVGCEHCHVEHHWDADEKRPKLAARQMILMARAINEDHLQKMKNLDNDKPAVNCTTCHRGQLRPALDLPQK